MKIAITATNPSLDANVDPRLGRCAYFVFVDPETMDYEVVDNAAAFAGGGAGVATAQAVASKGAEVVLTGNCGPNAYRGLEAAGIKVITGISGTVKDAIIDYKAGKFKEVEQPNVSSHFGMGRRSF
jgi:predicted Fe-Mo cluster-binding NifX family protein